MVSKHFLTAAISGLFVSAFLVGASKPNHSKSDQEIRDSVVMIGGNHGLCSGTQIQAPSGRLYILSAGHCDPIIRNNTVEVTTEAGDHYIREVVKEDPNSDLLLIESVPNVPANQIAESDHRFERIRTFTHGAGLPTYETEGVIIINKEVEVPLFEIGSDADKAKCDGSSKYASEEGDFGVSICVIKKVETFTTAMTVPGSSGGEMVDSDGNIVGVLTGGDAHFSVFVTLEDIKDFLRNY